MPTPNKKTLNYIPLVSKSAINKDTKEWGILNIEEKPKLINTNSNIIPGTNIEYNTLKIEDKRIKSLASGKNIRPNVDLKSGEYNKGIIENIIDASLKHDVDPYYALATGLQESGFASSDSNTGHVIGDWGSKIPSDVNQEEAMVIALKIKKDEAVKQGLQKEEDIIQHYNGRSIKGLHKNTESGYYARPNKMFYGVPLPINTKTNPVYGRQIIDLRDNVIKQNPEIQSMINKKRESFYLDKESKNKLGTDFNKYIPSNVNTKTKLPWIPIIL